MANAWPGGNFMSTPSAILLSIILTLTSCEGIIHLQGHVLDKGTGKPLKNTQVILVLRGHDTLKKIRFEYDTVPYNKRMALRKAGLKDDYQDYNVGGLSKKPTICTTDTTGRFVIGSILIPCVPKCPACELIFIKNGYKQAALRLSSIANDTITLSLEKLSDTLITKGQ